MNRDRGLTVLNEMLGEEQAKKGSTDLGEDLSRLSREYVIGFPRRGDMAPPPARP